ncbi:MAG: tRNA lysidine(34) synthetase TilS [Candidatus Nanopelagicales bacterium]
MATAPFGSDELILVGCSGGADSLALAAVAAHLSAFGGPRVGALIVDHQLQAGSAGIAEVAAQHCRELGLSPVIVLTVDVATGPGNGGLEAAARSARRAAMTEAAAELGASAVLLAHSLDDQAETVLLGLARGSGSRSMAGMVARDGLWVRPLLGIRREALREVVAQAGLTAHDDPHNVDPSFARVRVRSQAMPALQVALGEGIAINLARSAQLVRADVEALDSWTQAEVAQRVSMLADPDSGPFATVLIDPVDPTPLRELPGAIRTRVLRSAILAAGVPAGSLTADHLLRSDVLLVSGSATAIIRLPADFQLRWVSDKLTVQSAGPMHQLAHEPRSHE